jgi:hypothetical protein
MRDLAAVIEVITGLLYRLAEVDPRSGGHVFFFSREEAELVERLSRVWQKKRLWFLEYHRHRDQLLDQTEDQATIAALILPDLMVEEADILAEGW